MAVTTVQVYQTMKDFHTQNGYSPSVRELAGIIGTSTGSVHRHIKRLKKIGWLSGESNKARTIKFHK